MAEMDKTTRILMIYSKLLAGGKIYKKSFCADTGINRRTFDRDIEDIRLYLSESFMGYELVYDHASESYRLENYHQQKPLSPMEISFLMELIKSEKVLRKDEYEQLLYNLIQAGAWDKQEMLMKIARKEIRLYPEDEEKEALLKMQWDLQQCIHDRDIIILMLQKRRRKRLSPVSLWISDGEIYLLGYGDEDALQIIPVNMIESFQMERKKYSAELVKKFQGLDWQILKEKMIKEKREYGEEKKEY